MSQKLNPYFGQAAQGPNGEQGLHYAGAPKATLGANAFCLSYNEDSELCIFMIEEKADGQFDTPAGLVKCLGPDNNSQDLENQAQAAQRHLLEKGRLNADAFNSSPVFVTQETRDINIGGTNQHTFVSEVYLFSIKNDLINGCPQQIPVQDGQKAFDGYWIPLSNINPDVTGGAGSTSDRGYSFKLKDGTSGNIPIVYSDLITKTVKAYFNEEAQNSAGLTLKGIRDFGVLFGLDVSEQPTNMFGAEGKKYIDGIRKLKTEVPRKLRQAVLAQ
jgi:hypothetical protein